MRFLRSRKSFTLIELLVTLAIVAILSVVVIMTLNPSELLKQARDSNRLSDLSTLNTALSAYSADVNGGFMGTSSVVYVSIPDTTSTCANLGLPTLPTGWSYNCVTTTSTKLSDGTGWIPVNFSNISFGSPLSSLPVDPINTTTTGNYYTYVSGGSFILTAIPESAKQKTALASNPNISNYPGVIATGNNLSLSPLYNPSGLVGYWNFDEGSGTVAKDSSGNGNDGTFMGASPVWDRGKMNGALRFNQANQAVNKTFSTSSVPAQLSISFWFNVDSINASTYRDMVAITNSDVGRFHLYGAGVNEIFWYPSIHSGVAPTPGSWCFVVGSFDGSTSRIYIDGALKASGVTSPYTFLQMRVGSDGEVFNGLIDDVRYYTRALSAAEIAALYNATK